MWDLFQISPAEQKNIAKRCITAPAMTYQVIAGHIKSDKKSPTRRRPFRSELLQPPNVQIKSNISKSSQRYQNQIKYVNQSQQEKSNKEMVASVPSRSSHLILPAFPCQRSVILQTHRLPPVVTDQSYLAHNFLIFQTSQIQGIMFYKFITLGVDLHDPSISDGLF